MESDQQQEEEKEKGKQPQNNEQSQVVTKEVEEKKAGDGSGSNLDINIETEKRNLDGANNRTVSRDARTQQYLDSLIRINDVNLQESLEMAIDDFFGQTRQYPDVDYNTMIGFVTDWLDLIDVPPRDLRNLMHRVRVLREYDVDDDDDDEIGQGTQRAETDYFVHFDMKRMTQEENARGVYDHGMPRSEGEYFTALDQAIRNTQDEEVANLLDRGATLLSHVQPQPHMSLTSEPDSTCKNLQVFVNLDEYDFDFPFDPEEILSELDGSQDKPGEGLVSLEVDPVPLLGSASGSRQQGQPTSNQQLHPQSEKGKGLQDERESRNPSSQPQAHMPLTSEADPAKMNLQDIVNLDEHYVAYDKKEVMQQVNLGDGGFLDEMMSINEEENFAALDQTMWNTQDEETLNVLDERTILLGDPQPQPTPNPQLHSHNGSDRLSRIVGRRSVDKKKLQDKAAQGSESFIRFEYQHFGGFLRKNNRTNQEQQEVEYPMHSYSSVPGGDDQIPGHNMNPVPNPQLHSQVDDDDLLRQFMPVGKESQELKPPHQSPNTRNVIWSARPPFSSFLEIRSEITQQQDRDHNVERLRQQLNSPGSLPPDLHHTISTEDFQKSEEDRKDEANDKKSRGNEDRQAREPLF